MRLQPGGDGLGVAVGQQVDRKRHQYPT
jgi:hypothetical protein